MTQLPPSAQQSGYGGSQSYIWSPKRLLGKGTSGHIYRGWDKKTAKKCAVKEFKSTASKHAAREVEVIRHLSHPNIVRVMGIETNSRTGENILVMEYCDGGSLYSKIREPENFYGLPEDELLRVVVHISSGLKYLHQNSIVHRDIKPGNIMCTTTKDGTSYKLSDFGTAKVLKTTECNSSEEFPTLQGTEEYMHPELVGGLVYRDASGYTIKADLYSLGITIYQAATGSLPFMVPGGRQDKEGRVKLISEKPRGMISGFIDPFGKTKWESELPATCRISRSLKNILEDILANVLEQDAKRAWSFDTYFMTIDQLRSKVVLHVFVVRTCAHHRIYLEPTCREDYPVSSINSQQTSMTTEMLKWLIHLQDKLAALEDVPVEDQVLLYGECLLQDIIGLESKVIDYRPTSEEHPITFLQESAMTESEMTNLKASLVLPPVRFKHYQVSVAAKLPTLPENVDLDKDYNNGREFMATAFYVEREAKRMLVLRNTNYRKQIAAHFNNLWKETKVKIQQGTLCLELLSGFGSTDKEEKGHRNGYSMDAKARSPNLEEMASFVREATARFEEIKANHQKKSLDKNEKQIHLVDRYHLRKAANDSVQLLNRQFVDPLLVYHADCISQLRKLNENKRKMDRLETLVMNREEERQRASKEWDEVFNKIFSHVPPDNTERHHTPSSYGESGQFAAGKKHQAAFAFAKVS